MNPSDARAALAAQFEEELASARRMLDLLDEERRALKAQDLAAMETAARAKLELHATWEALGARRDGLLRQAGFDAGREGLAACIAWCDEGGRLASQWQDLAALLESCRRTNRANGMAIELCRRQVDETLAILHGQPAPGTALYDANGAAAPAGEGRPLGSA